MTMSFDKREAVFWGEFILCAYSMYAPGVTNPLQPSNFPSGWKLVKNITADAVVGYFRQNEFLGFVAQSLVEPQKHAVVLHGTEGLADFLDDFEFLMTDFKLVPNGGRTEYGFTRFYESFSFIDPTSGASQSLEQYLNEVEPTASYTIAGCSLGAALATLHAIVLASRNVPVEVYSFASPMVGNSTFVRTYNALVPNTYRMVNQPDIVPHLPGTLLGYEHVNTPFEINSLDVPEIRRSITCYHSLNTHLYVLGATNADLGSCKVNV